MAGSTFNPIKSLNTRDVLLLASIFITLFISIYITLKKIFKKLFQDTFPVLTADIGGTNCRLKILRLSGDSNISPELIKEDKLRPWNYQSIEELLIEFLKDLKNSSDYPHFAVLGIPGAVSNNTMLKLANIPHWKPTNGSELAKKLNMKKLVFLNDFVCNGYGIQTNLKINEDYVMLNNKNISNSAKKLIVGPGTGFGVCYLNKPKQSKYYNVNESEGSKLDFAPKTKISFGYLEYCKKYFNINVLSNDKAIVGPSIIPMYQYLNTQFQGIQRHEELGKSVDKITIKSDKELIDQLNNKILDYGMEGKCPLCKKVIEFFIELFAEFTGGLSMFTLPYGGVYIVGSILPRMEEILRNVDNNIFFKYYKNRGELNHLLEDIPVVLIKNKNLGMIGAMEYARRLINGEE